MTFVVQADSGALIGSGIHDKQHDSADTTPDREGQQPDAIQASKRYLNDDPSEYPTAGVPDTSSPDPSLPSPAFT
jgi:hypothetical protein